MSKSQVNFLDGNDTEDMQDRPAPMILFAFLDDSEPKTDKEPNLNWSLPLWTQQNL
jgi:hypothetical protein